MCVYDHVSYTQIFSERPGSGASYIRSFCQRVGAACLVLEECPPNITAFFLSVRLHLLPAPCNTNAGEPPETFIACCFDRFNQLIMTHLHNCWVTRKASCLQSVSRQFVASIYSSLAPFSDVFCKSAEKNCRPAFSLRLP